MTCSKVDPCASLNSGGCSIHVSMGLPPEPGTTAKQATNKVISQVWLKHFQKKHHSFHGSFKVFL